MKRNKYNISHIKLLKMIKKGKLKENARIYISDCPECFIWEKGTLYFCGEPAWKKYNFKRTDCYGYLAHKLGLHLRETHFGWFDIEYLNKSLEILSNIDFNDIWKYIKERTDKNGVMDTQSR